LFADGRLLRANTNVDTGSPEHFVEYKSKHAIPVKIKLTLKAILHILGPRKRISYQST
jgi:hypothetical protein